MKKLIAAAVIAVGLALTPGVAHADETLPPYTYDVTLPGVLNCAKGTWTVVTVHYAAEQVSPEVYGPLVEQSRTTETGMATGGGPGTDCPNWKVTYDANGVPVAWVNVNTGSQIAVERATVAPPPPPPVVLAAVEVSAVTESDESDRLLPRAGAAGRYWP